jgi:riboflavin synthase
MFTGIVEEVGEVLRAGERLQVRCRKVLSDTVEGASIAVNGVCVTAVRLQADSFSADLSPETLSRSNLGFLTTGSIVNLERPVAVGDRLSGHIVQGHVDGTGEVVSLEPLGDGNYWLLVRAPAELERYTIHKGSITIDGVSLTIASLDGSAVGAAVIPHTYDHTAMRTYRPGGRVNIEVDMIAKYVEKLVRNPGS